MVGDSNDAICALTEGTASSRCVMSRKHLSDVGGHMDVRSFSLGIVLATQALLPAALISQGCNDLLRNGAFNTFNSNDFERSSSEWHRALCSGTVASSGSS